MPAKICSMCLCFAFFLKTALQNAKRERPPRCPQRPVSAANERSRRSALIGRRDVSTLKTGTISWRRVGVLAKQTCWCLEGRSGESAQALRLKYFAQNAHMSVLFASRRFQSDSARMWRKKKLKTKSREQYWISCLDLVFSEKRGGNYQFRGGFPHVATALLTNHNSQPDV